MGMQKTRFDFIQRIDSHQPTHQQNITFLKNAYFTSPEPKARFYRFSTQTQRASGFCERFYFTSFQNNTSGYLSGIKRQ